MGRISRGLLLLGALVSVLTVSGSFGEPAAAGGRGEKGAGSSPLKVASLLPYVDDALRQSPGRSQLVAGVRRGSASSTPKDLVDLGSSHTPSFESLAGSGARLVIGDGRLHGALRSKLEGVGAEVMMLDGGSVASTLDGLVQVGRRVGAEREMAAAVAATKGAIRQLALRRPVRVLALFGAPGSFMVVTRQTWLGDLLGELRFRDVAAGVGASRSFPGYAEVNDEVLASWRPDLVLLVSHGAPEEVDRAFRQRIAGPGPWHGLAAARLGIHVLDPELFAANPGLRLDEAARRLVALAGS
jgi:iron complex transport system substrate-binding protein